MVTPYFKNFTTTKTTVCTGIDIKPTYLYDMYTFLFIFFLGCECVVYQSTGQKGARNFHSPNYTTSSHYPRGIVCILFSFIGDVNETVEITFIDFNLRPKVNNKWVAFIMDL